MNRKPVLTLSLFIAIFLGVLIFSKTHKKNVVTETDTNQAPFDEASGSAETAAFKACLNAAYKAFTTEWNNKCSTDGVNSHQANCNLPADVSDAVNQHWKTAKEACKK
jgi:hypothetical protein